MNNKGFAITSILFGILVLFLLVLVSLLGVLRSQRFRMEKLSDSVNSAIGEVVCEEVNGDYGVDLSGNTIDGEFGRYIISIEQESGGKECFLYVKNYDVISLDAGKIKVNNSDVTNLINCDNSSITSAIVTQHCSYETKSDS